MSNDNGNRTGAPAPTWVTHAYPPGPQPAAPAPLPAPYTAETTVVPLVEEMPAPVDPSGWRRWLVPALTAGIVAAAGLAGGYTIGHATTPASCIQALDAADELNALADEYADIAGRAVEAAGSWDQAAMDDVAAEGEAFAARYEMALVSYEDAAADCRAEGGAR